MNLVARFARLSPRDRRQIAIAVVALPVARASLAVMGFKRTCRAFGMVFPARPSIVVLEPAKLHAVARGTAGRVAAAARHGRSGATCLPRSIVTWALLRRQGVPSELKIGTRRQDGRFEAHAWVEVDGATIDVVTPESAQPFVPFSIPERAILERRVLRSGDAR